MSEWSTYPWVLDALAVWVYCKKTVHRQGSRSLLVFGLTWAIPFIIGLSLFADKKPNYALLVWPMLSWAIAYGLCRLKIPGLTRWHRTGYRWLAPAAIAIAIIAALIPIDIQSEKRSELAQALDWIEQNEIARDQIAVHKLAPNDYCYIYLKTTPPTWPNESTDTSAYILSREKKRPDSKRKFQAGKYYIWKRRPED